MTSLPCFRRRARALRHASRPDVQVLESRLAPTVSTFADNLLAVAGVETDPVGNVYAGAVDNVLLGQRSVVRIYNSSGVFLRSIQLEESGLVTAPAHLVRLGQHATSLKSTYRPGDLYTLLPSGTVYHVDPASGFASFAFDVTLVHVSNLGSVWDSNGGRYHNFGGSLQPSFASYGDIAVANGAVVVSGVSRGIPFVMRLDMSNGLPISGKILAASSDSETDPGLHYSQERGVAIGNDGTVLTTLPVGGGTTGTGWDVPVAMGIRHTEGQGRAPFFPFGTGADRQTSSRGMATDDAGNFLIATGPVGSALNLQQHGLITIDAGLTRMTGQPLGSPTWLNSRDVAHSPKTGLVYVAMADQGAVWSTGYTPPVPAQVIGGSLQGTVYSDTDGDGTRDAGEPGLAGWTVYVDYDSNGPSDKQTVTDSQGRYSLDLRPGTYGIKVKAQAGYARSEPSLFDGRFVQITSGAIETGENFGFRPLPNVGRISGYVYEDRNKNGRTDSADLGMGGWTIVLDANDNGTADPGERATVTDNHGYYEFLNVSVGSYIVRPIIEPGWDYDSGSGPIRGNLLAGSEHDASHIRVRRLSTRGLLSGHVFDDKNGDGQRQADEPGLSGWTVFLDANQNGARDAGETATTSDANGFYRFLDLDPGRYYIQRLIPAGWKATAPRLTNGQADGVMNFADVSGYPVNHLDFGQARVSATASIAGNVYRDDDAGGGRNGDEPGLPGWTVYIDANENNQRDEGESAVITDANGDYIFTNLAPGRYVIQREVPFRWRWSEPQIGGFGYGVSLFANVTDGPITGMNFGQFPPPPRGSISGVVYDDRNGNGRRDEGEPGLPDWVVFLDADEDQQLDADEASLRTDAEGAFHFEDLDRTRYYINHVLKDGWQATEPGSGLYWFADVGNTEIAGMNFGVRLPILPGALEGSVYEDVNGNGRRDAGEPGQPGATVFLDTNQDGVIQASERRATTDAQGNFRFDNLAPGQYYINSVVPPGWHQTAPALLSGRTLGIYFFANVTDSPLGGLDFGRRRGEGGAIAGIVYHDANGNGRRDQGEPALAGRTVFLDANGNARLDPGERSTTTDAQGTYRFEGLGPARYNIAQVLPPGWSQTVPALPGGETAGIFWFADVAGEAVNGLDFAARAETTPPTSRVATLPAIVYGDHVTVRWSGNDGAGGSGIASYDVYISDNGGPFVPWIRATTVTSARFTGRPGHTYRFYSIATDALGNVQPVPTSRQVKVRLEPPLVRLAKLRARTDRSGRWTALTLTFTGPLNAASARLTSAYRLTLAGKNGSFTARDAKPLRIRLATYDPRRRTVTLTLAAPTPRSRPAQLLIRGLGARAVKDVRRRPLDGDRDARPGGDARVVLNRAGTVTMIRLFLPP